MTSQPLALHDGREPSTLVLAAVRLVADEGCGVHVAVIEEVELEYRRAAVDAREVRIAGVCSRNATVRAVYDSLQSARAVDVLEREIDVNAQRHRRTRRVDVDNPPPGDGRVHTSSVDRPVVSSARRHHEQQGDEL